MALFKIIVSKRVTFEIPVFAESESEALAYAKTNDEWKMDGGIDAPYGKWDDNITIERAEIVDNPATTDWDSDVICWNQGYPSEEITVAQAMYAYPISTKLDPLNEEDWSKIEEIFDAAEARYNKEKSKK